MKYILFLTSVLFLIEALVCPSPNKNSLENFRDSFKNLIWHQDVVLTTSEVYLPKEPLLARIPQKSSIYDWYFKRDLIKDRVQNHPFVSKVSIERCHWYSLTCFKMNVVAKIPAYIATINDSLWVIAENGSYFAPYLELLEFDGWREYLEKLPKLYGISYGETAPALYNGRLNYLISSHKVLEGELNAKVASLRLLPSGELFTRLRGEEYIAIFDYSEKDLSLLGKEAARLKSVTDKLGKRMNLVKEIDLAYDKMAVVKFKES